MKETHQEILRVKMYNDLWTLRFTKVGGEYPQRELKHILSWTGDLCIQRLVNLLSVNNISSSTIYLYNGLGFIREWFQKLWLKEVFYVTADRETTLRIISEVKIDRCTCICLIFTWYCLKDFTYRHGVIMCDLYMYSVTFLANYHIDNKSKLLD